MKKLGKLSINPENVIKNEELVNLKGGYGSFLCRCGFVGNYTSDSFFVAANDIVEALQIAGDHCDGDGATCSGV